MATVAEIERLAFQLPSDQRELLARNLLASLSPFQETEEEEMAEAMRRSAEMRADPSVGISLEEFDRRFKALGF